MSNKIVVVIVASCFEQHILFSIFFSFWEAKAFSTYKFTFFCLIFVVINPLSILLTFVYTEALSGVRKIEDSGSSMAAMETMSPYDVTLGHHILSWA